MNEFTDLVRKWMSDVSGLAMVSTFGFYIAYKKNLEWFTFIVVMTILLFSTLIVVGQLNELKDFKMKHESIKIHQRLVFFGIVVIYLLMLTQIGFAVMTLQQITG
ncbi:hypothetical protein [Laribacter hongkongensis]|uniref:hypothetical protein n=1 Tax=Laribacter hongkongensis TaxID=168471 RepID=UPI0012DDF951|nr:hypothetical protein [Laribacter hongkongensis]